MAYNEIDRCRICGNRNLVPVLDLGDQYLSGVFPATRDHLDTLTHGPLELVKCHDECPDAVCGLLQLHQSYDPAEMYGDNYGYRSSLNLSMVNHLRSIVNRIEGIVALEEGDCIVDIGSNDGTLLRAYDRSGVDLIGFDPAGEKFRRYYPDHIRLIPDFFSAAALRDTVGRRKAKVVTSIAMLYDLEDPLSFAREVSKVLADDGIWVTEQSYMPAMLRDAFYDTVCHEHLEYYGLRQIRWMAERASLRIIGGELNAINGGSCSVVLAPKEVPYPAVNKIAPREPDSLEPYADFARRVALSKLDLQSFLEMAKADGMRVLGLGASTKGNTLLQYCGVTEELLPAIGEVNQDKFGHFTPGTRIPILPEAEVLALRPDYLLVLPWHFREYFLSSPRYAGTRLVFPLPNLEMVER